MSVKKSRCNALQSIGSNNKISKRAMGKEPGIDRKMRGGWDVSNNVRTENFRTKKIGAAWNGFKKEKRATSEGWRKGKCGKRKKEGDLGDNK